jgi:hypothetical protein
MKMNMELEQAQTLITALLNSQRYFIMALKSTNPRLAPSQDAILLEIFIRNEEIASALGLKVESIQEMIRNVHELQLLERMYSTSAPGSDSTHGSSRQL